MTLSTVLLLVIIIIILVAGILFAIINFIRKRTEEGLSNLLITISLELICTSFGTLDEKIIAFLSHKEAGTNYVQLGAGTVLFVVGVYLYFYVRNRLYILNINGYFDKRIEHHHKELNLNPFEFKEKEIDFIRLYKKGINQAISDDIIEELTEKIGSFKIESQGRKRAYTGIAPIPLIMFSGKIFERQVINSFFEYNKLTDRYYRLIESKKRMFGSAYPNAYSDELGHIIR